jgi:PAS domain S-box-containing protein
MTPQQFLDAIPVGAIAYERSGADFAPIRWNAAACDILGLEPTAIAATTLRGHVADLDGARIAEAADGAMATGAAARVRVGAPDGSARSVEVVLTRWDGWCVACFTPIAAAPAEDADAAMTAARIAEAAEAADIGVWEFWPREDRMRWSPAARRLLGVERVALSGTSQDLRALLADARADRLETFLANLRDAGRDVGDWRIVTPDGRARCVETRTRVVDVDRDGRPEHALGVILDVTETRALQAALEASRAEAEAGAEAKSRFLATMSHEIRTPLNGLIGMAELLDRALTEPAQRRMISVIRDTGSTVLAIVNDILDHARIEAGRMTLEEAPFSPLDLARRVEASHGATASDKGLFLRVEADAGSTAMRAGDPHRVTQMLHNLVGNALKFTERGGVTIRVRAPMGGPVVYEIADTGPGMTAEQTARLFDRFAQAEASTARRFGGSGLGLSIVKGIAEAMGGAVAIESAPGRGTVARVTLPLSSLAPAADRAARQGAAPSLAALRGLRVLAADDNEINRLVLSQMLDALGVEARVEASGEALLEARTTESFDVILLDIAMPGFDGPTTLEALRRIERERGLPSPPALAFTANVLPEHVAEYHQIGFSGHLPKPVTLSALSETLAAHAGLAA